MLSTVTVSPASAPESAGLLTFHVKLDAPSSQDVRLNYSTRPGTARPGQDYKAKPGKLTIPAGETEGDIVVVVKDDARYEADETFRLALRASGATLGQGEVTGTIVNDDAAPAVTIKKRVVKEGDAGQRVVTFTAILAARADTPVVVTYATSDETPYFSAATAGSDYVAADGTLTFLPGQKKKTFNVIIKGDTVHEGDETFLITVASGESSNAVGVTIRDDDKARKKDAPVLSIEDTTVGEGEAEPSVTVTLSRPSDEDVTFRYVTTNAPRINKRGGLVLRTLSTAVPGSDFIRSIGSVTIPAGQTSATIPLSIIDDSTPELINESFYVRLHAVKGARLINNRPIAFASVSIADNDSHVFMAASGFALADYVLAAGYPDGLQLAQGASLNASVYPTYSYPSYTYTAATATINPVQTVTVWPAPPTVGGVLTVGGVNTVNIGSNVTYTGSGGLIAYTGNYPGFLSLSVLDDIDLPTSTLTLSGWTPDAVRALLHSAFSGGTWSGLGIPSTPASEDPDHRIALAYAAQPDGTVIVKPALYGDANLDGVVDDADLVLVQQSLADPAAAPSWSAGDFNYDNHIDADDLSLLDRNFGRSIGA